MNGMNGMNGMGGVSTNCNQLVLLLDLGPQMVPVRS